MVCYSLYREYKENIEQQLKEEKLKEEQRLKEDQKLKEELEQLKAEKEVLNAEKTQLKAENERLKIDLVALVVPDPTKCYKCKHNKINTILTDCSHATYCNACLDLKLVTKCYMCETIVSRFIVL